jgi:hypothetical protein
MSLGSIGITRHPCTTVATTKSRISSGKRDGILGIGEVRVIPMDSEIENDNVTYGTGQWLSEASACAVKHLDGLIETQDEFGKAMECLGFIAGMMDTIHFTNRIAEKYLPEEEKVIFRVFTNELTFEDIVRSVHLYLAINPEKIELTRIEIIGEALLDKFKGRDKP